VHKGSEMKRVSPSLLLKMKSPLLVGLLAVIFTFYLFNFIRHRGVLYGGYDGIQHLTCIEGQILSFRNFQGAASFSSMARYIGDARPLIVYQGFYWFAGAIGALLHLGPYEALSASLCLIPFLCFIVAYCSFFWIRDSFLRSIVSFFYSFSPMLIGMCFHTASWPQTFAAVFIPIIVGGGWLLWGYGNPYLLALGFAVVTVCHPVTGVVFVPWALMLSLFSVYRHRGKFPVLLLHGVIAVGLIVAAISYLFFGNIDPGYAFAGSGGGGSRSQILEQINILMDMFGRFESSARFAQIFRWPHPDPSSSLGFIGCLSAIFVIFSSFFGVKPARTRDYLGSFGYLLISGTVFYLITVWPWDWLQIHFKLMVAPYFSLATNLFPNRLVPLCLIFCTSTLGFLLDTKYKNFIISKKFMGVVFGLLIVNCLQTAQGLKATPLGDIGPFSNNEDARLSEFFYGNKFKFRKEFLWDEERRPRPNTAHTYIQPMRMWRWRSAGESWKKAEWSSTPTQIIHSPFHEFQPAISHQGLLPFVAGSYRVAINDLPKGVYNLRVRFKIAEMNLKEAYAVPLEAQIQHGYSSLEGWIFPDKIKWDQVPLKVEQTLDVPFEIEADRLENSYLLFRKFTGYSIQLSSIEIYPLNQLPFQVQNYQNLEFTLPQKFLNIDRELSLPRFALPGYRLWEKTSGDGLREIPLEETEFATPKARFPKTDHDMQLILTFSPKSFVMNHRFLIFIVSSMMLLLLTKRLSHRRISGKS